VGLVAGSAVAETRKLDLDECLNLALQNSEDLRVAGFQIGQADDQVEEALGGALPQVSTEARWTRFIESPVLDTDFGEFSIKEDWDLTLSARVSQVLWAFGKVANAIEAAEVYRDVQELSKEQLKVELGFAVKQAYFQALKAERILKISAESLANAKRNQKALRRRFARGRVPRYENLKMEADLALRRPALIQAEQELANLKALIKLLTGIDQQTPIAIVGEWPQAGSTAVNQGLIGEIYKKNVELKLLASQHELYAKQTQNERASRYPTIAAFGTYERAGTGSEYYIGGDNLNDTVAAGLSITYDIWNGGTRSARIASSLKEQQIVDEKRGKLKRKIAQEVAAIRANLDKLDANLDASRRAKELAEKSYELTLTRYESGQATQTELNDAEKNLTDSRKGIEQILFQMQMERIKVEKLLARVHS
jgi:outer membrane protein TolC